MQKPKDIYQNTNRLFFWIYEEAAKVCYLIS